MSGPAPRNPGDVVSIGAIRRLIGLEVDEVEAVVGDADEIDVAAEKQTAVGGGSDGIFNPKRWSERAQEALCSQGF